VNRKSQRPHFPEKVSFESQAIVWEDCVFEMRVKYVERGFHDGTAIDTEKQTNWSLSHSEVDELLPTLFASASSQAKASVIDAAASMLSGDERLDAIGRGRGRP
jgi:hypothetical protein